MAGHRTEAAHAGDRALQHVDVPVADDHSAAPRQQRFCGRMPDATSSTGDHDGLTPDVVHADELYRCQLCRETSAAGSANAYRQCLTDRLNRLLEFVLCS